MPAKRKYSESNIGQIKGNYKIVDLSYIRGRCSFLCECQNCKNYQEVRPSDFEKGMQYCIKCMPHNLQDYKTMNSSDAQLSIVYSNYKSRCKSKNREFNLTKSQFKKLILSNCYYCGAEPSNIRMDRSKLRAKKKIYTNGIDRVDSDKGYIISNVVSCCEDCNKAKRQLSKDTFLKMIKDIYENLKLQNLK